MVPLAGVLAFGWPAGNVFFLFWVENVVLGLCTIVKMMTVEGSSHRYPFFFTLHYGIFCVVHLAFTAIVAWRIGLVFSLAYFGLPVVLLLLRYTVELATSWFGAQGQRRRLSEGQVMMQPYARVIVLHLSVLLGFGLVMAAYSRGLPSGTVGDGVRDFLPFIPTGPQGDGVAVITVLLLIKTAVDVLTTHRALRAH